MYESINLKYYCMLQDMVNYADDIITNSELLHRHASLQLNFFTTLENKKFAIENVINNIIALSNNLEQVLKETCSAMMRKSSVKRKKQSMYCLYCTDTRPPQQESSGMNINRKQSLVDTIQPLCTLDP